MKNGFFRFLLAVYSFFMTIVSMIALLISLKIIAFDVFYDIGVSMLTSAKSSLIVTITAFISAVLSLLFLIFSISAGKKQKAIVKQTEIGEIMISLNTFENIALSVVRRIAGLKDSKAYVRRNDELLSMKIVTSVVPDINIPSIAEEIQNKVKSTIEKSTGIEVKNIKVHIDNLYFGYKPRVE